MKCQAHKSNGEPCNAQAVKGKRVCRVHGGMSLGGVASPTFKHGRYSKHLPARLSTRYMEAATDGELLELRSEVALLDARISDVLQRVDNGENGALWDRLEMLRQEAVYYASRDPKKASATMNDIMRTIQDGHTDYAAWREISALIEQRRRLVESERKRLIEMHQTITAEKAMMLLGVVVGVIREHVHDRETLNAISRKIQQLATFDG